MRPEPVTQGGPDNQPGDPTVMALGDRIKPSAPKPASPKPNSANASAPTANASAAMRAAASPQASTTSSPKTASATPSTKPADMPADPAVPFRQIRATHTATTITVYQAYSTAIADRALLARRFVAPFKRDRMTWIKPSLLWMAYRSGWATKPGQERVLAIEITRDGFEWALAHASLSRHEPGTYPDHDTWAAAKASSSVRIQWDPERDLTLAPLGHRAIQIGLSGLAVERYVDDWTIAITDTTDLMHQLKTLVAGGDHESALRLLPDEQPYPLDHDLADAIGAR
jgi:hypothetical protein